MKYFTSELYLRFNSADDAEADQADLEWKGAIAQYGRYLKEHRAGMPPTVRKLAENCCFHDAVLLGRQTHGLNGVLRSKAGRVLTVGLRQGDEMIVLSYFLCDLPRESKRPRNWPFSAVGKHWLYDEISIAENSTYVHRILWSDGCESAIPFADVIVDRFPALTPVEA